MSGDLKHAAFQDLVDEHLDARRDPLDDPRVCVYLEQHPELLDGFTDLTATLHAFDAEPVQSTRAPRRFAAIAGVALLVLGVAFAGWKLVGFGPSESPALSEPALVLPDIAEDGRVIRYSCRTYTEGPDGQSERRIQAMAFSIHERNVQTNIQPGVATPHGHSIRTELSHLSSRVRPESSSQ